MSIEGMSDHIKLHEEGPAGEPVAGVAANVNVDHVMTRDVVFISVESPLHDAQELLVECGIHGAPVLDGAGHLRGIVSQTDLLRAVKKGTADSVKVASIMTRIAHAVRPETAAATAAALMIRHSIRRLIVVDQELKLVGIVAALDLLRLLPGVKERLAAP